MGASVPYSCLITKKRVLFEFESSPFLGDRLVQGARMALSLAMDANVTLLYRGAASILAGDTVRFRHPSRDVHDQERFLIEMVTPIHVLSDDWDLYRKCGLTLRTSVTVVDRGAVHDLHIHSDLVFTI